MVSFNNNNSEIDMDTVYMKYGQCRCCLAKGQHRDVDKEYYYNNIKEVYRDVFADCFSLSLSPHNQISPLICDSCVQRLRDASTFRMMVASNEEQLLKTVIIKSEPEMDNEFSVVKPNFTTDVKIETDSEPEMNSDDEPNLFQDDMESSTDDEQVNEDVLMNDEAWIDDEEGMSDEPVNVELNNDERSEETRKGGVVNEKERVNEVEGTRDEWGDVFDQINDEDDDWSTDTDNELVIDEDRKSESSGTDELLSDEDLDDCGSIFSSTITRSSVSAVDDEPSSMIRGEKRLLSRTAPVRLLPKRRHLAKAYPEFDGYLKQLEYKLVQPKSLEWFFTTPETEKPPELPLTDKPPEMPITENPPAVNVPERPRRQYRTRGKEDQKSLATNATILFEYSNATAFKTKMRRGYPCFYCREVYDMKRLREHQEQKHPKSTIFSSLSKYNADEFVMYAEISYLKCTLCEKSIKDLKDLKTHLFEEHEKRMVEAADRIIPFKIQEMDFKCQICGEVFENFTGVEKHMNKHYGSFACETCGTAFITKHRLSVHCYASHRDDKINCEICNKTFRTQMKKRIHYESVHMNKKKIKCTKCPETFVDYFTRQKHLIDEHGENQKRYSCNECDKAFTRKFGLNVHVKRCHLVLRNFVCTQCPFTSYTHHELNDHLLTHGGPVSSFECPVCKKVYNRKRSLAMHLKKHRNENINPAVMGSNNSGANVNNPVLAGNANQ